jgi:hypothetical protein
LFLNFQLEQNFVSFCLVYDQNISLHANIAVTYKGPCIHAAALVLLFSMNHFFIYIFFFFLIGRSRIPDKQHGIAVSDGLCVAVWSGERGREGGKDRERGGGKRKGVFVFVIEGDLGACTIKLFRAISYAAASQAVVFVTAGDDPPGLICVG